MARFPGGRFSIWVWPPLLRKLDTDRLSPKFAVHVDDRERTTATRAADLRVELAPTGGDYEVTVQGIGTTVCASDAEVSALASRLAALCIGHGPRARAADLFDHIAGIGEVQPRL